MKINCYERDALVRVVVKEPAIRLAVGGFPELCSEGIRRHDADPVAGRLLADALCAAALMTVLLDEGEKFSIRIDYPGPVGAILVDAAADGRVRGLVRNPHVMTVADSVETACGREGSKIQVTRSRDGKILNSGEAESAFIMPAAALGYFLSVSDQVESEIDCEIELQPDVEHPVKTAGGVLVQAMPGCDLQQFDRIRQRALQPETGEILRRCEVSPEERLRALLMFLLERLDLPEYAMTPVEPARFECNCSGDRLRKTAVEMLGKEDFQKLLAENPNPAIHCQFCNSEYRLSADDLPE